MFDGQNVQCTTVQCVVTKKLFLVSDGQKWGMIITNKPIISRSMPDNATL